MKNLSLRLRLMILFVGFSCLIWVTAGFVCWQESKEKIDEFFDSYQMLLARQMASADWSHVSMQTQKITNKIIKNIKNAEDEDEAIGFAVFNADGKMIFHDNENGKDFSFIQITFASRMGSGNQSDTAPCGIRERSTVCDIGDLVHSDHRWPHRSDRHFQSLLFFTPCQDICMATSFKEECTPIAGKKLSTLVQRHHTATVMI